MLLWATKALVTAVLLLVNLLQFPKLALGQNLAESDRKVNDGPKHDLVKPDRDDIRSAGKGGNGMAGGFKARMDPVCLKNPSKSGEKYSNAGKLYPKVEAYTFVGDKGCKRFLWYGKTDRTENYFGSLEECREACPHQAFQKVYEKYNDILSQIDPMPPSASDIMGNLQDIKNSAWCQGPESCESSWKWCTTKCNLPYPPAKGVGGDVIDALGLKPPKMGKGALTPEMMSVLDCFMPNMLEADGKRQQCYAFIPAWTYVLPKDATEAAMGDCVYVTYGGCGTTTSNIFRSRMECEKTCKTGMEEMITAERARLRKEACFTLDDFLGIVDKCYPS